MRLNNLPLLRLSEVYLSAAEAAAKLGGHQDKAAKYLNEIVLRANPEAKAVSEADATVERIILERRKENKGADKSCKCVIIMTDFAGKICKKLREY